MSAHREPTVVGITKYRHEPSRVEVPARAAAALIFERATASSTKAG